MDTEALSLYKSNHIHCMPALFIIQCCTFVYDFKLVFRYSGISVALAPKCKLLCYRNLLGGNLPNLCRILLKRNFSNSCWNMLSRNVPNCCWNDWKRNLPNSYPNS